MSCMSIFNEFFWDLLDIFWTYRTLFVTRKTNYEVILMRATDFFQVVYNTVGRKKFTNQAHFISILFNAAGSSYFDVEPTKKYGSNAYQIKIFNGTKKISNDIKNSFPLPIDKDSLLSFFSEHINEHTADSIIKKFNIEISNFIDVERVNKALVEQFVLFITTEIDYVNNIMNEIYNDETNFNKNEMILVNDEALALRQKWKYNIVLLDDMEEQLEMLKEEMDVLFKNEFRYAVSIFACKNFFEVILNSHNMDVDVYVLDVARKPFHKGQTKEYDYFGYDLYKQIVTEKPNALVKSKFYIYSRLPLSTIRKEFEGAEVEWMQKQRHSNAEMAIVVKDHIDKLFDKESIALQEYTTDR